LKPKLSKLSPAQIEEMRDLFINRPDVSAVKYFKSTDLREFGKNIENKASEILKKNIDIFLNTKGVACFSETNNNLLMWAHYGGKYKGFCLEFKTEFEPFEDLRKVKYSENMPVFDTLSTFKYKEYDGVIDLVCTKSKSWEYEKEWRLMHDKAGSLFIYPAEALKAIYFGPDIEIQSLEIVCLVLAGQNPNVKFWKGKRSQEKFEVLFEEFKYTSHSEAKSKGLL
jgi:hypothetical protein